MYFWSYFLQLATQQICIPLISISSNLARNCTRWIDGSAAVNQVKVKCWVTIIGTFAPISGHSEASSRPCVIRTIANIESFTSGQRSTKVRTLLHGMGTPTLLEEDKEGFMISDSVRERERVGRERNKQLYMSKINKDLPPQAQYRRLRSHHGKDACTSKDLMDLLHPHKAKVVTN